MLPHEMNDNELVMKFVAGNQEAMEQLIRRHKRRVFTYILLIVKNREMSEDIFQETFLKVIRSLREGKYVDDGKFLGWVMRIAHNLIIDNVRKEKRLRIVSKDGYDYDLFNHKKYADSTVEQKMVNSEIQTDIRKLMDELPELQRQVVIMRHFMDMSFKEIAEETNVSINTALGRMRYALLNMRRLIEEKKLNMKLE